MIKKDFLETVGSKIGSIVSSKKDVETVFDAVVDSLVEELTKGEDITFGKLGKFSVKNKKARNGINPKTKAKIVIAAKKAVAFKASKTLKDVLNG